MAQQLQIDGILFNSLRAVAKAYGITLYEASNRIAENAFPTWIRISNTNPKKPVRTFKTETIVDGVVYESIRAASEAFGISYGGVYRRCQSVHSPNWTCVTIAKREHGAKTRPRPDFKRVITVDGVVYKNARIAGEAFGISDGGAVQRCISANFPNWTCPNIVKKKLRIRVPKQVRLPKPKKEQRPKQVPVSKPKKEQRPKQVTSVQLLTDKERREFEVSAITEWMQKNKVKKLPENVAEAEYVYRVKGENS